LPLPIVQQYIHTIEAQMRLIAELGSFKLTHEAPKMTVNAKPSSFEQLLQIATDCANLTPP
jgi:hypothetical protein